MELRVQPVSGTLSAIDPSLLRSSMRKPMQFTKLPRPLTGMPITNESLDQLAGSLMATDAYSGKSSAISDSIVFSGVNPSNAVKTSLKSLNRNRLGREIYPRDVTFATCLHSPEETINRAQWCRSCCEETAPYGGWADYRASLEDQTLREVAQKKRPVAMMIPGGSSDGEEDDAESPEEESLSCEELQPGAGHVRPGRDPISNVISQ